MRPTDLILLLVAMFRYRLPILITGAPGIGKSNLVEQAAAQAGCDLILSHPAVSDPTDVKGLPWFHEGAATFLPFGELARALAATRPTVWMLDDLGQATPATQAAHMQLILARRVNGHVLPDCVTFAAATNRKGDKAGVAGILEPVKSRFASIVELEAHLGDFCEWGLANGLPAEVIAYNRMFPDQLSAFVPSADMVNSPSPRTWAHVGKLLGLDLPTHVLAAAIGGAVGPTVGTQFMAFLKMYRELPNVDALLIDPMSGTLPASNGTMYAVCGALAYRATAQNFQRVGQIATRLFNEQRGEFASLLIRDATRRSPELAQTEAYIRLSCGPLGKLMTGAAA